MAVAVVTGSSSGIGQATAIALANQGFDLVLHGNKNLAGLHETAKTIHEQTDRQNKTIAMTCDLANASCCRSLIEFAFRWQGNVDAWINVAGADVLTGSLAKSNFESKLERLWQVDVAATIRVSRAVAEKWTCDTAGKAPGEKPSLVNIGWDQSLTGMEGEAGQLFCTTKAAVEAFTRALALELAPRARVNLVAPGWIETKWGADASEYWKNRACEESLLGRWGTAKDVADTVAWICSPAAAFVNSQVIAVNGGLRPLQRTD
ncbi:MAG: SDR family oxidoreductase [Planctomycetota bacterium]